MVYYKPEKAEYNAAAEIINAALSAANPYDAVFNKLKGKIYKKPPIVIAFGKAASPMAAAAYDALGGRIKKGIVVTKYDHAKDIPPLFEVFEAGHPVSDENTVIASKKVLESTLILDGNDTVLVLISGGGSALFEIPLCSLERQKEISDMLMKKGADIFELNTVRKRLSEVKGGRFAEHCLPATVEVLALSDVIGDRADVIASGPCSPDNSTCDQAVSVIKKYGICLSAQEQEFLNTETPKRLFNTDIKIVGNLKILCEAAKSAAEGLGYKAHIISTEKQGEARVFGNEIAQFALKIKAENKGKAALIYGGETTVTVRGSGRGGRNQEIALEAARVIDSREGIIIFSLGSDGTDGPTDAAGGIADGKTARKLSDRGISLLEELNNNNSYYALKESGGLIITGATGTNVNDLSVALID